ncbi:MAG: hypothetical protein PHD97_01205 [Bacteroidales bacterium]|nr:hypothetical protein [Bacteroidales bacterium]
MIIKADKPILISLILLLFIYASCHKEKPIPTPENGKIVLKFAHYINGQLMEKDTLKYVNAAANTYEVDELKYFISELTLYKNDGTKKIINDWVEIFYVDIDISSTLTWNVYDDIPAGDYDSINFVFGITQEKNKSFMFVNPPESNMAWPEILGGGYHYMMLNGKWKDASLNIQNFRCHLGIGKDTTGGNTTFIQNYFKVSIPNSSFSISKNQTKEIQIIMNVEKWFEGVYIFDWNYYGGDIMENQEAMNKIAQNGKNAFSLGYIH